MSGQDGGLLARERAELAACCHRVAAAGLVTGSAGNLSVRSGELVAVTSRRRALGEIEPDDCPVLDLDGEIVGGDATPSSETQMHLSIYATRGDALAIVHTHSTFAAVLSTLVDELPAVHYAIAQLGGPIRVAEYATFGTQRLADNVCRALDGRQAALIANHGVVVIGNGLRQAFDRAVSVEWLAELYYRARLFGAPRLLDDRELADVVERAAFKGYWREPGGGRGAGRPDDPALDGRAAGRPDDPAPDGGRGAGRPGGAGPR